MTDLDSEIKTARARVEAVEVALQALPEELEREFKAATRDLAHLEERAAQARFAADPSYEAVIQSLRQADIDTSMFADIADQLRDIDELKRILGTYGYEIVRRA